MKMRFLLSTGLLLLVSLESSAALPGVRDTTNPPFMTHPYTKAYQQCMNSGGGNTPEAISCMSTELKYWDTRLNQVYRDVLKTSASPQSWKEAQRKWLTFRDAQCHAMIASPAGSAGETDYEGCQLNMTLERTLQLEDANWPAA
ncbi:lysozyme inhibitor LprI family protein [Klebsiella aerogenes]|uniref:lysozyme inhibitor LprI family protein n=1 Tax=Klebsiella aerogenes TaxID=548 RepID=UPI000F7ED9C2|nr:lysozyme inhibitor LprI family protein [Klebsiella aerogenes]RSV86555.1 DUF1311 domain-containing protein [Klebsiella aerogenes]HBY9708571.1 DUF1311 domain-containing protein [Klebsiella aerogenes]